MATSRAERPLRILLAVSGSIAAYKAADVVSRLRSEGHEVRCLLTASARRFVTPTVLETLSGHPVHSDLFDPGVSGTEHIRLARWADVLAFMPASANLIARLSLGLSDDLVTTVALASNAPWVVAPAMNTVMWNQAVTRAHVATLRARGARVVEPAAGTLACREEGVGKLAPIEDLVSAIYEAAGQASQEVSPEVAPKVALNTAGDLTSVRILITAGPTISPIDAVRYITNHSTGRMGAAIAEEALARGAEVRYVLGVDKGVVRPQAPAGTELRLRLTEVRTAEEMLDAALRELPEVDGVVATAAVLDYRVATPSAGKLKRATEPVALELVPSADVLSSLRERARPGQWFMGFAAETDEIERNGAAKLAKKNLDYLFANRVARAGERLDTGFGTMTNGGVLLRAGQEPVEIPMRDKRALAREIWNHIAPTRNA